MDGFTETQIAIIRSQFESTISSVMGLGNSLEQSPDGEYLDADVQRHWEMWVAHARLYSQWNSIDDCLPPDDLTVQVFSRYWVCPFTAFRRKGKWLEFISEDELVDIDISHWREIYVPTQFMTQTKKGF